MYQVSGSCYRYLSSTRYAGSVSTGLGTAGDARAIKGGALCDRNNEEAVTSGWDDGMARMWLDVSPMRRQCGANAALMRRSCGSMMGRVWGAREDDEE